jgi:ubiquinone biosynthesis UbiH/UbiF/VisC/COQ6 family hydroxylase
LAAVRLQSNVQFFCPATVASLQYKSQSVELQLHSAGEPSVLSCRLAIIADGANSSMCQRLGIHAEVQDYGQTAIVANIATDEPHKGVAYERFTAQGPMALLPLLGTRAFAHRSALIWTMPTADAQSLLEASDGKFLQALQEHFGYRQGHFIHVGVRASYPLRLSSAKEQVRQRTVVLGNAAHSLHPVAGQGFNLALRDAAVLADIIAKADSAKEDFASLAVLQRYIEKQGHDQWLTMAFSDVLPALFSSASRPLKIARGMGLLSLELLPGFKSFFVKFATGIRQGKA